MARCGEITEVLRALFTSLHTQRVTLEAVILKPNMALPSSGCAERPSAEEVADATLACLRRAVPAAVPGIAFLSGGQAGELASARLNAMNLRSRPCVPWAWGSRLAARSSSQRLRSGMASQRDGGAASAAPSREMQPDGPPR